MPNPNVFFDISIGGQPAGRIVMEVSAVYLINLAVCQNKLSLINIFKNKNL
jgi:hypothetical protein